MAKELLFSLTKKDFELQFFRAGGKGGQKQNKTSSACRITHPASGAVGEAREERSQHQNRVTAFRRLLESPKFKSWYRMECNRHLSRRKTPEEIVESQMREENLRVEVKDEGKWVSE